MKKALIGIAAVAVFLAGAAAMAIAQTELFSDVPDSHPAADAIEWAASVGVTTGYGDGTFRPSEPLKRRHARVFLERYYDRVLGADGDDNYRSAEFTRADMMVLLHTMAGRPEPVSGRQSDEPDAYSWTAPLERCAEPGAPGATLLSVLVGVDGSQSDNRTASYEPVVTPADRPSSCQRIKEYWVAAVQQEQERIVAGEYPCEYAGAVDYWPDSKRSNGPAMLVGCWPRVLWWGGLGDRPDPDDAAAYTEWKNALVAAESYFLMPPNHPALVEALWRCYRSALQGTQPEGGGRSPTLPFCAGYDLQNLGHPVRTVGVSPECAAEMYTNQIAEKLESGKRSSGAWSWSNCSTAASRLLDGTEDSYSEQCRAVTTRAKNGGTKLLAEEAADGSTTDDVVAAVQAMYCDGRRQSVLDNAADYEKFLIWSGYGVYAARRLPLEGEVCYEAAMLVAAKNAVQGSGSFTPYC